MLPDPQKFLLLVFFYFARIYQTLNVYVIERKDIFVCFVHGMENHPQSL